MDEADIAKTLQTDLNFHKVKIQVKRTENQLHILATRDDDYAINYDFLFALLQSRLEQLRLAGAASFTLYGRLVGSKLPEWKQSGIINQLNSHSPDKIKTLIVVDGQVEKIEVAEYASIPAKPVALNLFAEPYRAMATLAKPIAFLFLAVLIPLGIWFIWDRSIQQQKLNQAEVVGTKLNHSQLVNIEQLLSDRLEVSNAIKLLQEIPDRPGPIYAQAQGQISKLKSQLETLDFKIAIEQPAAQKLYLAKKLAQEASAIVQKPPHKAKVWRSAQGKWLEALKNLETIPQNTFAYIETTQKLSLYRVNYRDITFRLQNQLHIDAAVYFLPNLNRDGIAPEMLELRTTGINKSEFMDICVPFVSNNLDPTEVQKQRIQITSFSEYLCVNWWLKPHRNNLRSY